MESALILQTDTCSLFLLPGDGTNGLYFLIPSVLYDSRKELQGLIQHAEMYFLSKGPYPPSGLSAEIPYLYTVEIRKESHLFLKDAHLLLCARDPSSPLEGLDFRMALNCFAAFLFYLGRERVEDIIHMEML
jgi:hypothetical protein